MSVHRFLCLHLFLFPSTLPSLENGLCKATRSCDMAEPFEFPVLHCYEEVFTRADVVFVRTGHLFICDMVFVEMLKILRLLTNLFLIATVVRLAITV